ncbi:MAG: class I SAM-dependent rRNA methyltransferase [bacterium]|jgi:23S rRNA (cytosine1962-C5)-methyltransferase|nr:class I SAM-dependent rRNA methyltransferase [bacterium]
MNALSLNPVVIKPRQGKRAKGGHPWIFSNEIEHPTPRPEPGELVRVLDDSRRWLGYGTYNPHSLIAIRLLSRQEEDIPGSVPWFQEKIRQALTLRERIYPERTAYRLIYADSDGLSGVIVDRYESVLVVQIHTAGMERLLEPFTEALKDVLHPTAIVLRNTHEKRTLENLPLYTTVLLGEIGETIPFHENQIQLLADVQGGQKTGHFFDQAENRLALGPFARGQNCVDLFCHTGAWGLSLLKAGASQVLAIDSSQPAIAMARQNAEQNGVGSALECLCLDAFEWLSQMRREKRQFDLVVVDPPAFAKSAKQVNGALRGYEDLNRQAIHIVRDGGILCSCSCSYFIGEQEFLQVLQKAAAREQRQIQCLEIRGQAKDHPIHLAMPETRYLKCVIGVVRSV